MTKSDVNTAMSLRDGRPSTSRSPDPRSSTPLLRPSPLPLSFLRIFAGVTVRPPHPAVRHEAEDEDGRPDAYHGHLQRLQ